MSGSPHKRAKRLEAEGKHAEAQRVLNKVSAKSEERQRKVVARKRARLRAAPEPMPYSGPLDIPDRDPLTIYRAALQLFRRAGLPWSVAYVPAERAALQVVPWDERDEWRNVLAETRGTWWLAYELRDIDHPVSL